MEMTGCTLNDGATRIFLNTRGKNDDEEPKKLVNFLHYLEHTTDETAMQSDEEGKAEGLGLGIKEGRKVKYT